MFALGQTIFTNCTGQLAQQRINIEWKGTVCGNNGFKHWFTVGQTLEICGIMKIPLMLQPAAAIANS